MTLTSDEITRLLERWGRGDERALEELWPRVYGELRRLASSYLSRERPDHTLQPTALVHEAFLRVSGYRIDWENRSKFVGVFANAMRRVLVDYARERKAEKRGGGERPLPLEGRDLASPAADPDLLALDKVLSELEEAFPQKGRVVELRHFGDLSTEETAQVLGVSTATVERDWRFAKAWLRARLTE